MHIIYAFVVFFLYLSIYRYLSVLPHCHYFNRLIVTAHWSNPGGYRWMDHLIAWPKQNEGQLTPQHKIRDVLYMFSFNVVFQCSQVTPFWVGNPITTVPQPQRKQTFVKFVSKYKMFIQEKHSILLSANYVSAILSKFEWFSILNGGMNIFHIFGSEA